MWALWITGWQRFARRCSPTLINPIATWDTRAEAEAEAWNRNAIPKQGLIRAVPLPRVG